MSTIEKLDMKSPDLAESKIDELARLFPECVKESENDQGQTVRSIDFDQLRQELATAVVDGSRERYTLDWPGKREAQVLADSPVTKTLRPSREYSVDFDSTKNLYVEGNNLDAQKLLQET